MKRDFDVLPKVYELPERASDDTNWSSE